MSEFETSLVYSEFQDRQATQRNPVLKGCVCVCVIKNLKLNVLYLYKNTTRFELLEINYEEK